MNNDRFKFRVWDEKYKNYVAPSTVALLPSGVIAETDFDEGLFGTLPFSPDISTELIVEQCTGLRDRNGKPIYEGDILENTPAGWTFRVEWNGAAWFAESDEPPLLERLNIMPLGICKVVGNVHEVKHE